MATKQCSGCKEIKPMEAFHKNDGGKYGIRGNCIECANKQKRQYYKNNIEIVREYRKNNAEYLKKIQLKRRQILLIEGDSIKWQHIDQFI